MIAETSIKASGDKVRLATLFSGIGAPEFAAHEVFDEVETVFACEIDKFARQSYLANHEIDETKFYRDVTGLDTRPYAGKIDILIGGSPCQDFSTAGQRAGEDGERGNLIWQFYRVVSEARPKVFLYENVKGFLSINGGRSYQGFMDALRGLGYHCHAEILNTKDYGIPQNRERLYIVGFLNADEYYAFSYAPEQSLKLNLGDMLDAEVGEKYFLSKRATKGFEKKENTSGSFIKIAGKLDIKGNDIIKRVYATDGVAPTIHTAQGGNQEPKILQCERIRKLTHRECLRLQGFPESFKIVVSDTQAYKQAGNAMSVNVVKMILERIKLAKNKEFRLGA
ncbi:DNA (cytosine-5-)-methyltransferase [Campylobacter showae]|uniref:DNA cytosine methyltransferase n=1 Tax=Campylobacter showae TaxID=204 RepID=UPI0028D83B06|nr:DNA (cytosine-5-)-methyltransferase [Campylobacter showae]